MAENALQHHPVSGLTGLDEQDITLVEHNFAALMSFSDALAERFYQRLFSEYPAIMPLFKSVTIEGQHKKLLASMVLLIQHLRDSEMIEDYLQGLGGDISNMASNNPIMRCSSKTGYPWLPNFLSRNGMTRYNTPGEMFWSMLLN